MSSWDRRMAAAERVGFDPTRNTERRRVVSSELPAGLHPDDAAALDLLVRHAQQLGETFTATIIGRISMPDGEADELVDLTVVATPTGARVVATTTPVASATDVLTGLPGRDHMFAEVERALSDCKMPYSVGVFAVDIDRFKTVNDSRGFEAGDRLIRSVATALAHLLRPDDTLTRVGGDEFVIICPGILGPAEATALAERFRSISRATPDDASLGNISLSVGYTIGTTESVGSMLIRESETALYNAKGLGRDRVQLFDEDLRAVVERRLSIDQWLRQALDDDAIEVHYQPIVDLSTEQIVGVEALLRIHGDGDSYLDPRELVSAAEDNGLIRRVEETVVKQAIATLNATKGSQNEPLFMSINIADGRLTDSRFPLSLARTLHKAGASADRIHLEIHPAAVSGSSAGTRLITQLRALGVTIVMDELSNTFDGDLVKASSVDRVKIDRRMIRAIHDPRGRSRAALLIDAMRERGIDVCAVGIETAEDLEVVKQLGCRFGQGFLFSPPVNREKLWELLGVQDSSTGPSSIGESPESSSVETQTSPTNVAPPRVPNPAGP